jgi:uncharacterized membrane protein
MNEIIKKIANFIWKLFGQYQVIILPAIWFVIITIFYNIGEITYEQTYGESVGAFGFIARIMFFATLIWVSIKGIIAFKNQYKEFKENRRRKNERNKNKKGL